MEPRISVIVPVYNVELYLEQCVDSIRKQTLHEIEIILIDDGSPDNCPQMCDQYAEEDERIRVIHQKNAGVSAARNVGLRMARGEYIAFVDSDDWVDPNYLSILLEHMIPGGMAVCNFVREKDIVSNKDLAQNAPEEYETVILNQEEAQISVMRCNSEKNIHSGPYCKLYERSMIEKYQVMFCEDISYVEDELFVIQYISHIIKKVIWVQIATYHYRCRSQSAIDQKMRGVKEYNPRIFSGNIPNYRLYLQDIRTNLLCYLGCDGELLSAKIAAVLCAIHPRLYYLFLKMWFFTCDPRSGIIAKWKH